ncbi:hypothetical protein [Paraburkholderia haematera]|uniref:Uncharacterized protein n=1 Tax=Paraburkholderia haematera TaxID=2793077 RepID=A0ABM8QTG1_9BURK|nr:hypothetical protein [Paraburkholderia haematera]CAE6714112.1 hypothetical protein R69888_01289 [Paraburkholderia haematera]
MMTIELTGRVFGRFTVLARDGSEGGKAAWRVQCSCGTVRRVAGVSLRNGVSTSCGCSKKEAGYMPKGSGERIEDLTIAEHAERSGLSLSAVYRNLRKYGHPTPDDATKAAVLCAEENELRVFEQDRENNRRAPSKRLGRAANTHRQTNTLPARAVAEDGANDAYVAEWMARASEQRIKPIQAIEPKPVRAEVAPVHEQPVEEPDGHDVLWRGMTLAEWSHLSGETVRMLFIRLLTTGNPFSEQDKS